MGVRRLLKTVKTQLRRLRKNSDYGRWGDASELSAKWDSRTIKIAKLVPPGSSVLEFGAARLVLRKHLVDCPLYTPSDLVSRTPDTLVCDLNARELPAFPAHDVAVFSGVLEYINDVPRVVAALAPSFPRVVASYAVKDARKSVARRRSGGWVNDYTSAEFEQIFARSGYRLEHTEPWSSQKIFVFARSPRHPRRS
jgi:hypothetical protein